MAAGCRVTSAWTNKMATLPARFEGACRDGMAIAIKEVERRARRQARWNKDGTDTGKWLVTGTARRAILGYVAGDTPKYAAFDMVEPKYKHKHRSPESADLDYQSAKPGHIIGVLTMTEQHSKRLQQYEIKGTKSGMAPGEPITKQAIKDNEVLIWMTIRQVLRYRNLIK
jgi:hypothetical protein